MRGNDRWAVVLLWGVALGAATPALAQRTRSVPIDTTGQSLTAALTDIAQRSGRELLMARPALKARPAPRLKGRYTLDQALPLLLAGSGLTYRRTTDGAYVVDAAPTLAPPAPDVPVALPELLVTARSQNSDIQRTENDIQAYKVWSSRDIQQSHSADINEFLRMMATGDTQIASALQDPSNTTASPRSEVNLRGMGSNQTLILVDGRRMPGLPPAGGATTMVAQTDVNGLPLAAIDRIEVLNATAGGVYGAGATAGAINIVLKRDYRGADVGVTYGITDRGDAPVRRLDGRIGFSPDEGRTNVMVAFGLLRGDGLDVGDRDYEVTARARRYRNDPAQASIENPVSGSVNIFSATGEPLTLDPAYGGASLGANSTFAPASYGGVASDRGAMLLANAGRVDTGLSPDVRGARRALLSRRTTASVIASIRHRFGASVEAYADVLAMRNQGRARVPQGGVGGVVGLDADAPGNPFQQSIYMTVPLPGLDPVGRNTAKTARASFGAIIDLPRDWKLNADYGVGRASIDADLVEQDLAGAYYDGVASGQIDPLGGQQAFLANVAKVTVPAHSTLAQSNRFKDISLRLAGPVLDLGGGPMTLSLAVEDRHEAVPSTTAHLSSGGFGSIDLMINGLVQSTRQYYGELRAPLTDRYAGPAGLRGLEFQLALRRETSRQGPPTNASPGGLINAVTEHSSQSSTLYTTGFKVFPVSWLMARASLSSGFVPPVAAQLGSTTIHYTSDPVAYAAATGRKVLLPAENQPVDPRRGGEPLGQLGVYDLRSGGAIGLRPEHARSFSAGLVVTPLNRLRVSIDYTQIKKRQEIFNFHNGDTTFFLQNEDQFPGRVRRAALTDADRARGYTAGVITAIDTTSFNIGRTFVEAVDLQGDYLIPTERLGDFRLRAAATWQPHLRRRTDPRSPALDYVDYADGPLSWRANGGLDWSKGGTTLGFNVYFYGGYRIFGRSDIAERIAQLTLWQGADRVPSQAYVDLFASRRITFGQALKDAEVRLGVQNLLDHRPPVIADRVGFGLDAFNYSTYGDPRRRRLELGLVARF
ncbi:TonB-dependent receptor [Caulobacter sp. RL271]|uniref:TonB-dependent receptor n=1 Tax=Caulobacter segnis TaxID=88688 RepID=A0ABY4ZWZ3_9CAUL|nr:TonB-dependent receptor [Caulobacter segnis]USQ97220.1 TonB-dependent receptor [Caulobacter segnis]